MLKQKLQEDLKTSLKSGNAAAAGVLRLVISAVNNKEIEKKMKGGGEITEEEVVSTLMTESKKRKESIEVFTKGGRSDLADKEKIELEIIQRYLPRQMSEEEIKKAVGEILKKSGSKEIGHAMKAVMAELKGKADAGMVSQAVKEMLAK